MEYDFGLEGAVAVVTGGAMGIGLAIAHKLLDVGALVVACDVNRGALERALEALPGAEGHVTDVSTAEQVEELVDAVMSAHGRLDVVVNNAGIFPATPLAALTPEKFDHVVAVNLRGVYLMTRAASAVMRPGSTVIQVTSIDALHPSMVGLATYDATKHGVYGFSRNVALELAPRGIRVNMVAPGGVRTPGTGATDLPPDALAEFTKHIPMARWGEPEEIAEVVLFLASRMSSYMTGSQVVVDGGALLS